ncbi:MAG: hypothetical protein M1836_001417 [Candelina mexicana]|nr:MAG: hypothetical protein M1836_001417 [Candelina mexicana]
MSEVQAYLLYIGNNDGEAQSIARRAAKRLETKDLKLLDLVQSLGEYLTEDDITIRANAIAFLAAILAALPSKFLSRQQTQVLCTFFCDRLADEGGGLKSAARGLLELQRSGRFDQVAAVQTATAQASTLIDNCQDLQRHPQSVRLGVLTLLDGLMSEHRKAMKSMGTTALVGITDLVAGEKDPRNLMIIFSVLRVIMVEWDVSKHAETLFESVFCYFPITFRPKPDDPIGITAQDLKSRLRDCVASTSYFAPFAFPALIDKLDSTSPVVKVAFAKGSDLRVDMEQKDVLQTLAACSASYRPSTIANYSITLWDSLKFEVLNAEEEDLADEALTVLQVIAKRLSEDPTTATSRTALTKYIEPISKECNQQLQEPQQKQAKPAGQILGTVAAASSSAFILVIKAAVAPLLTIYQDSGGFVKQRALLEVLNQLFDSAMEVFGPWSSLTPYPAIANPLVAFRDRLFEIFSQALMSTAKEEVSLRVVALKGLLRLCRLRNFLEDSEIGMVVQYFDEVVLLEESHGRDELKSKAIQALVQLSKVKSQLIMDITFPAFMAKLPDADDDVQKQYLTTLEGLAELSVEKEIFETLLRRLLNKLDVVVKATPAPAYPSAILSTLLFVLRKRDLKQDPKLGTYYEKVTDLIKRTTLSTGALQNSALKTIPVMDVLGRLSNLIVRDLSVEMQQKVAEQSYKLFTCRDEFQQVPLQATASVEQRRTMILSAYLLAGIRREINLPLDDFPGADSPSSIVSHLVGIAQGEDDPPTRLATLRQIALFTNKNLKPSKASPEGIDREHVVSNVLYNLLEPNNLSENGVRTTIWIAKALALKSDPSLSLVLDELLRTLDNEDFGAFTARGFRLLISPDEVLSKENYAIVRLLHKQKVFAYCVPRIAELFRGADPTIKPNYLIALSGLLKSVSMEILMPHSDMLLPLLLQSIDLNDQDVKAATIDTLAVTIGENPKAVEGHVSSLINRLLSTARGKEFNSPKVREVALRCLCMFPRKFRNETLLPYKKQVTKDLMTILDDSKRVVRKEAVDCRAAWFNMDEPDQDD